MKLVIDLPDPVFRWLEQKAEFEFRTVEEEACVIIRKAHRRETENTNMALVSAIHRSQKEIKPGDCACSTVNEAR